MRSLSPHTRAVLQALLVTCLWATSWVLIKFGLQQIPALTFAGLRYTLAWLCLLPFALRPATRASLRALPRSGWLQLALLGVVFYALTQGAQFVALRHLPAITVNLLLNFTTLIVALLGAALLAERPAPLQWLGMIIALAGAALYFYWFGPAAGAWIGYAAGLVGVLANAVSAVMGRHINRARRLPPLAITTVSMGLGALLLLAAGLALEGLPALPLGAWAVILWLAVVNTAFAFTLWNHTLRTLSAIESSIINSLLIVQIPLLAWIFLDERPSPIQISGLLLAGLGALLVQWRRPARSPPPRHSPG